MKAPLGSRKFLLACEHRPSGNTGSTRKMKKLHCSAVLLLHSPEAEAKARALAELMTPCDCGGAVTLREVSQDDHDVGSRHTPESP